MNALSIENGRIFLQVNAWEKDCIAAIRQRPGKFWHPDRKQWSLPDTPENRSWVQGAAADVTRTYQQAPLVSAPPADKPATGASSEGCVCYVAAGSIYYKVPKERADQRTAIKNIAGCQWRPDCKMWSIPDTEENRASIRRIHHISPPAVDNGIPLSQPINPHPGIIRPDNVIGISPCPGHSDFLSLHLPGVLVPEHLATIKNIHGRRWNPEQKIWEIPYTKLTLRFIEKHFAINQLQWSFTPSENIPERLSEPEKTYAKPEQVIPAQYEAAVTALEQVLLLKRYSWRTIKSYKNCFRQFIKYYEMV